MAGVFCFHFLVLFDVLWQIIMVNLWMLSTAVSFTVAASFQRTTSRLSRRSLTVMASGDVPAFFKRSKFCVVGASQDQTKFGNKVLRCYVQHNYSVTPINKKTKEIEGLKCIPSLSDWVSQQTETAANDLGVSIVTPPGVTKGIVEEGYRLGIRYPTHRLFDSLCSYMHSSLTSTFTRLHTRY